MSGLLAVLWACVGTAEPPHDPSPPRSSETGHAPTATGPTGVVDTGAGPSVSAAVTWVAPPRAVPAGGRSQDHATVALRSDGTGMVVYTDDLRLRVARVGSDGALSPVPIESLANHGQVTSTPTGFLVVATHDGGEGLYGFPFGVDAAPAGPSVLLSTRHTLLPDVDVRRRSDGTVQGIVAATDGVSLGCIAFTDAFRARAPAPCPAPVSPEAATGTVAVEQTAVGPLYSWTELAPDRSLAVFVSDGVAPPLVVARLGDGVTMAGRPTLATVGDATPAREDDGLVVAYRGATASGAPVGSYLWHLGVSGVTTWRLGAHPDRGDVERVVISPIVGERLVVAYEAEGELWLEVRDAMDGAPLSPPEPVATEGPRLPRRPSVDLVLGDGGELQGVISWESGEPGSAVEDDGRVVRVRRFTVSGAR